MPGTLTIFAIGLAPCVFSSYLTIVKLRSHSNQIRSITAAPSVQPGVAPNPTYDYHYVDGIGYMIGDLLCKNNARSAYLRCAVNPSGPCRGCQHYEAMEVSSLERSEPGCDVFQKTVERRDRLPDRPS